MDYREHKLMDSQRHLFSLPEDVHYLNCAYMSPLPCSVEAAGMEGLLRKRNPTGLPPSEFFRGVDEVRSLFAQLVNAPDSKRVAPRVALIPSVSYGVGTVARNVKLQSGQNIVVIGDEFPSAVLPWRRLAREQNVELRTVTAPDGMDNRARLWNEKLYEAIDSKTAVVMLSHVHWSDGTLFKIEELSRRAREVGAIVVVDGTQSVGALPFDVSRIQPDALICAGYKWLFGGYGLSVAYFSQRFDNALPLEENWTSQVGSDDFSKLATYRDEYRPDASRFDGGQRGSFVLVPMLAAALRQIMEWGVANIQSYCSTLIDPLMQFAEESGAIVEDPEGRAAHLVGIRFPGASMKAIARELEDRKVYASLRGDALRVSPNVYNNSDDIEALMQALDACYSHNAHQKQRSLPQASP